MTTVLLQEPQGAEAALTVRVIVIIMLRENQELIMEDMDIALAVVSWGVKKEGVTLYVFSSMASERYIMACRLSVVVVLALDISSAGRRGHWANGCPY